MATSQFRLTSPLSETNRLASWKWPLGDHVTDRYMKQTSTQSDEAAPSRPCCLALIGAGRAGAFHMNSIFSGSRSIRLKYLIEEDKNRWDDLRSRWPLDNVQIIHPDELEGAVLADPEVEGCIIATPTPTHESLVRKCLEAGKHVCCEKPLAPSLEATKRCYQLAEKMGKILFCAFNRRFDPSYQDAYRRIRSGEVGHVQIIKYVSRDVPIPSVDYLKISGGIFLDSACHNIDLLNHFLGELPVKIYVAGSKFHPEMEQVKDDFDTISVTLHYPSGTIGNVEVVRHSPFGYDERMEIFGAEGMLMVNNEQPNQNTLWNTKGTHSSNPFHLSMARFMAAYRGELEHFALSIQEGKKEASVTAKTTQAVIKICLACGVSAKSGSPELIEWDENEVPDGYIMKRLKYASSSERM